VRLAEEPPAAGAIVNIGSDTSISVNDIAALVGRIAEVRPRWNRDEQLEMTEHRMSVDRIRAGWGWVPKMTMTRGIAATIADRRVSAMTVAA
jgi:nucleoside-diphosphate-sugar epimerase